MSVQSLTVLEKNDAASTFMRTISLDSVAVIESAQSHLFANSASQVSSLSNSITSTFAVLQAAFNKAASTNAMLADVLSAPGAAGSPSTGACYWQFPDFPHDSRHNPSGHFPHWEGVRMHIQRSGRSVIRKQYL